MNLRYLLFIITLKNINCYSPKRHVQTTSTNNFKNQKSKATDPVMPARYKIISTTNYEDPSITKGIAAEYFPEVEYPESIADSSKPFYHSASPFPNDVKSTFNSLVAKENSRAKSTIDYFWTPKEKSKEKVPATSQKEGVNDITVTKGNEINADNKGTTESLHEDITVLDVRDDSSNVRFPYSDNDIKKLFSNWSSIEQSAECNDTVYVVGFINDLDEVMKNITTIVTKEPNDEGYNSAVNTFESGWSDEFKLISTDRTPNKNLIMRHKTELNGYSSHTEEHPHQIRNPLFEDSDTNEAVTNLTLLLNEYITNVSSVEEMQSDFCNIGIVANETNTSCTEN